MSQSAWALPLLSAAHRVTCGHSSQSRMSDVGRELYTAWAISEGAVLYQDIWLPRGPLSSYWNGLLFASFGASMMTLAVANLALLALAVVLPYAHETTHGVVLSLVTMMLLLQSIRSARPRQCALGTGIALGLVLLTKQEVAIAAVCATLATVASEPSRVLRDRFVLLGWIAARAQPLRSGPHLRRSGRTRSS